MTGGGPGGGFCGPGAGFGVPGVILVIVEVEASQPKLVPGSQTSLPGPTPRKL